MQYRFLLPSAPLRPYVQFYGLLVQTGAEPAGATDDWVAPYLGKGLIFVLRREGDIRVSNGNFDQAAPSGYFLPQCTQRFRLRLQGQVMMLAVVFRPGQFRRFFSLPGSDLMDWQVLKFAEAGPRSLRELQERLRNLVNPQEQLQRIESYLLGQLARHDRSYTLVDAALDSLQSSPDALSLRELSTSLGYSDRYLRKTFQQELGIGIKAFQRIQRFTKAFQMIKADRYTKLSDVAYALGYFDQSHFNREFREFMGVSPNQFLSEVHPLQNQLYWR